MAIGPEPAMRPALSVGFVLAPRFTLCAFATFVDVLRLAADEGDRSRPIRCRWEVISPTSAPIRSSCGVSVAPDRRLGDPRAYDYVVVVGGLIDELERLDPRQTAFLRAAAQAGVPLVGVCTGAFALHAAGLMAGYRCCVSWFHRADFLERFEGLEPVADQIFVVDGDRLTCAGGASAAHLAAFLVERHLGEAVARKSLSIMILEGEPAEGPQPGSARGPRAHDPLVRRALNLMREAGAAPLPVATLAARLGVGRRMLERRFADDLRLSPAEAARRLRFSEARRLLAESDRSVAAVAAETGFCDASHLVRTFRKEEGVTPDAWRRSQRAQ